MNKKNSHLISQLRSLKEKTLSFKNQYEIDSQNPDIDFLNTEVDKLKEVIFAHTEMKKMIEKKEDTISLLFSYLNDDKFASDQDNLVALLNVAR